MRLRPPRPLEPSRARATPPLEALLEPAEDPLRRPATRFQALSRQAVTWHVTPMLPFMLPLMSLIYLLKVMVF